MQKVRITIPEEKKLPEDSRGYTKRIYQRYEGFAVITDGLFAVYSQENGCSPLAYFSPDEVTVVS